ncbi:MAG: acyl-CoA dehydrogenase [Deltaproteobacteria bacterium RBG_16_71_12]|nr:MAG: acyl-CoA dehydrogenase [Deltaproteobacteria bacterium RBG_16_71_12]
MPAKPTDLFDLDAQLTDEERAVRDTVRRFVEDQVLPHTAAWFRKGEFPWQLVPAFAELGLLGAPLSTHGCAGMSATSYWLALRELERADSGIRSFVSVQTSLVMVPIALFGSDAQQDRWLPALQQGKAIGCFGLTEPDAGSDPAAMRTRATKTAGGWVLTGAKRWITNGTRADVAVVWAKTGDDAASIRAFLVPRGTPGFTQTPMERKLSFRCSDTADLTFDDVRLPEDALLPGTKGLGSALKCLFEARGGIAFAVCGSAAASLQCAIDFAKERVAFGKPIAAMQLVQGKLAAMAVELAKAELVALSLARLKEAGRLEPVQVSVAKMNNVKCALEITRTCRDILAANGITDEYPVMRHMNNLETVSTYEGTNDVHLLVIGQFLTGYAAFRG